MDKNTVSPFFVPSGIFICGSAWYDFFCCITTWGKSEPSSSKDKEYDEQTKQYDIFQTY